MERLACVVGAVDRAVGVIHAWRVGLCPLADAESAVFHRPSPTSPKPRTWREPPVLSTGASTLLLDEGRLSARDNARAAALVDMADIPG